MIAPAVTELAEHTSTVKACALLGWSRATHYRARQPATPQPPVPRPTPPNALLAAEQATVLATLTCARFCDKSVAQTWATLLDEGTYLCSMSTMHRLLRSAGQAGERRRQATHPPRAKPELLATGPGQVWSWDITKLRGPQRGVYYDLYVLLDIFSRYVTGWTVAAREDAAIAANLIATAVAVHGRPHSVHADRGTSMTSKPVAQLLVDLGVARSHSRPHVSNDNPYSEAQFKTMKYAPVYPDRFGSLADARAFGETFFSYYNHEHRHSGIGLHTPASVHHGTADQIRAQRAATLNAAYQANPDRFHHRQPQPPPTPTTPAARRRLDQPTQPGGPHTDKLTRNCLSRLDIFRSANADSTASLDRFSGTFPRWWPRSAASSVVSSSVATVVYTTSDPCGRVTLARSVTAADRSATCSSTSRHQTRSNVWPDPAMVAISPATMVILSDRLAAATASSAARTWIGTGSTPTAVIPG